MKTVLNKTHELRTVCTMLTSIVDLRFSLLYWTCGCGVRRQVPCSEYMPALTKMR